ncbi:MAG: thioesterase II family protein [Syntrophothermus sp.]
MFLFPYAGGSSQIYRQWVRIAPDIFEICLIELPGHGRRFKEKCHLCLETLSEDLLESILPYLNKSFAFFGHSMGALIGYELAKLLLSRYNISPEHLFVSAHRSPDYEKKETPLYDLPEDILIEKLAELDGMPHEIFENRELLEIILPVIRSDFRICETYILKDHMPVNCPITAICGINDNYACYPHMQNWHRYTTDAFDLIKVEGNHFFILENEQKIISLITSSLYNRRKILPAESLEYHTSRLAGK